MMIGVLTLTAYIIGLRDGYAVAQTMAFSVLALSR